MPTNKITTADEAVAPIKDGASIMVGGFMTCGTPETLMDALVKRGSKNLTIICNDGGFPNVGVGKLIRNGQVKKLIASHVGLNPEVAAGMNNKTLEVLLVPQGTLAEQIRAAGAGLGGVLTPTGVGTIVAEGKQTLSLNGRDYLLEMPLKADFALLGGTVADEFGNAIFKGTTKNFNPLMGTAADHVILGADEVVQPGDIDPNTVHLSGIFVDTIVGGR
jgi:acetate CoA/acetoacetate CoA-transferase alpha subunit